LKPPKPSFPSDVFLYSSLFQDFAEQVSFYPKALKGYILNEIMSINIIQIKYSQ
jgi:hypothetical protein